MWHFNGQFEELIGISCIEKYLDWKHFSKLSIILTRLENLHQPLVGNFVCVALDNKHLICGFYKAIRIHFVIIDFIVCHILISLSLSIRITSMRSDRTSSQTSFKQLFRSKLSFVGSSLQINMKKRYSLLTFACANQLNFLFVW